LQLLRRFQNRSRNLGRGAHHERVVARHFRDEFGFFEAGYKSKSRRQYNNGWDCCMPPYGILSQLLTARSDTQRYHVKEKFLAFCLLTASMRFWFLLVHAASR
jgi:hypothetical protein